MRDGKPSTGNHQFLSAFDACQQLGKMGLGLGNGTGVHWIDVVM
jgi:hypothetical protein